MWNLPNEQNGKECPSARRNTSGSGRPSNHWRNRAGDCAHQCIESRPRLERRVQQHIEQNVYASERGCHQGGAHRKHRASRISKQHCNCEYGGSARMTSWQRSLGSSAHQSIATHFGHLVEHGGAGRGECCAKACPQEAHPPSLWISRRHHEPDSGSEQHQQAEPGLGQLAPNHRMAGCRRGIDNLDSRHRGRRISRRGGSGCWSD